MVVATIALAVVWLASASAQAAEVKVLSAVGMREVMLDLGPKFERASGHTLVTRFDAGGVIVNRVQGGEAVDVVLVPRAGLERLSQSGKIVAGSGADLASSIAGVAVRQGAAKPDISTPEAFKRALLAARSISRPDPSLGGSSGVHIARVLERLGIANEVQPKSVIASRPDERRDMPGAMVADGRAEMALHQVQELMAVAGIDIVGPFPAELQETFVFSGGVVTGAGSVEAARALIDFLRTPEAIALIQAKGMQPAGR